MKTITLRVLFLVFLASCSDDATMTPDASPEPDASVDAALPDAAPDATPAMCGDGVVTPGEMCLRPGEPLDVGPLVTLELAEVPGAALIVASADEAPRALDLDGVELAVLAGEPAAEMAIADIDGDGLEDVVVRGTDGSLRAHLGAGLGAAAWTVGAAARTGLAVGVVAGAGYDVVTVSGGSIERVRLDAAGQPSSTVTHAGARGDFVGLIDVDEDGLTDIIVGGAEFPAAVALDSFLQARGFADPVQAMGVRCPGPCTMTRMVQAEVFTSEVFDRVVDDLIAIVPGADDGDVEIYLGAGALNFFGFPIGVTAMGAADVAVGRFTADARADLAVVADCALSIYPGVPIGTGSPVASSAAQVQGVDGHCPEHVRALDVDGDGYDELVTASSQDAHVVVYRAEW